MGVRDSLKSNSKLGVGVAVGVLVVGMGIIGMQYFASGSGGMKVLKSAFYTDDDGKNFFKDDIYKVVPFDHNGKKAYRADVFQCADGKQFVGLMYRHNALGKKAMQDHITKKASDPRGTFLAGLEMQGMEVKLPGAPENTWKPNSGENTVKCPSGGPAQLVTP